MTALRLKSESKMVRVNVFIYNLSAERFWDVDKPLPPVRIATNLNIVGINKKNEDWLEAPFVFTINYQPAVAQISVKGKARVKGKKDELEKIHNAYTKKQPPPAIIVQSISNVVFLESVIISRTLNIPPPIPLPKIPPTKKKKLPEPDYRA
jgi:hypothetical protein